MALLTCSPLLRLAFAEIFAIAMAFKGVLVVTVAARGAATHALSRRNAGKLGWRKEPFTSKDVRLFLIDQTG